MSHFEDLYYKLEMNVVEVVVRSAVSKRQAAPSLKISTRKSRARSHSLHSLCHHGPVAMNTVSSLKSCIVSSAVLLLYLITFHIISQPHQNHCQCHISHKQQLRTHICIVSSAVLLLYLITFHIISQPHQNHCQCHISHKQQLPGPLLGSRCFNFAGI
eukprot:sb/3473015/